MVGALWKGYGALQKGYAISKWLVPCGWCPAEGLWLVLRNAKRKEKHFV